jgi:GNAT superfamily N-acetyltransferase
VTVRPLRDDEAKLFKDLRLRALADAPSAFAQTHAEIATKPDTYWDDMTRSVTEPGRHAMFVAEEDAAPVGLVFGLVDRERGDAAHLGGMWVDPSARGHGVGRALGDAVLGWARARCFRRIVLWVTEGNSSAIALYEGLGFAPTGHRNPSPVDPRLTILEMERAL